MVEETLDGRESISVEVRRNGVAPNLLYRWRRLMLEGESVAVAGDDGVTSNLQATCIGQEERHGVVRHVAARGRLQSYSRAPARWIITLVVPSDRQAGGEATCLGRISGSQRDAYRTANQIPEADSATVVIPRPASA